MVEKITITPNMVRGLGDIISPKTLSDFNKQYSTLTTTTDTVHGVTTTIYDLDSTILFWDKAITGMKNTNWTNYSNRLNISTDENGTTLTKGSSNGYYFVNNAQFIYSDYICEFDIVEVGGQAQWYHQASSTSTQDVINFASYNLNGKHIKMICQDGIMKVYADDIQVGSDISLTTSTPFEMGFRVNTSTTQDRYIKYKNFKVYL